MELYDLIIIGAGPAGLTASIYACCYHLKHLVMGSLLGGQLQYAPDIINYPGFKSISGKELTSHILDQLNSRGATILTQTVNKIIKITDKSQENPIFEIHTDNKKLYRTKAIILAT